jgi:hypothetical protein
MSHGYGLHTAKIIKEADGRLLGVKLGRLCVNNDISATDVAKKFHVTRQTIYNWFMGKTAIRNQNLIVAVQKYIEQLER